MSLHVSKGRSHLLTTGVPRSCPRNTSARSDDKSYLLSLCLNKIGFTRNALVWVLATWARGPHAFSAFDNISQVVCIRPELGIPCIFSTLLLIVQVASHLNHTAFVQRCFMQCSVLPFRNEATSVWTRGRLSCGLVWAPESMPISCWKMYLGICSRRLYLLSAIYIPAAARLPGSWSCSRGS
jgi:hypothetical protein